MLTMIRCISLAPAARGHRHFSRLFKDLIWALRLWQGALAILGALMRMTAIVQNGPKIRSNGVNEPLTGGRRPGTSPTATPNRSPMGNAANRGDIAAADEGHGRTRPYFATISIQAFAHDDRMRSRGMEGRPIVSSTSVCRRQDSLIADRRRMFRPPFPNAGRHGQGPVRLTAAARQGCPSSPPPPLRGKARRCACSSPWRNPSTASFR